MASTSIYDSFLEEVKLQNDITVQWGEDTPPSPITIVLTENEISLVSDQGIGVVALGHNTAAHDFEKAGEQNTQSRNKFAKKPLEIMHEIFALVKSIYPTNIAKVKDWCNNISVDGKIDYSTDWATNYAMFVFMNNKYLSYLAAPTPIDSFLDDNEYVMADLMIAMDNADAQNTLQGINEVASHNEIQQRNIIWAPVWVRTIMVRNFIIRLYINSSRKAAFYGVYVNEAKPGQVNQVSSASPGEQTEIHPLVKDTEIKNMNNFPITILVGQKETPREIIIPANGVIVVGAGMSHCTLKNTDLLNVAEIMVTVTRKTNS
jgi:hypothetical protein